MRIPTPDIIQAIRDPELLGGLFGGDLEPWRAWIAHLKAVFGLELDDSERFPVADPDLDVEQPRMMTELELARECCGGVEPRGPYSTVYSIIGRRGGKSRVASVVGSYLAAFCDYSGSLAPGESALVMSLAPTKSQAGIVLSYAEAALGLESLRPLVVPPSNKARNKISNSAGEIELVNVHGCPISLAVAACNYRTSRGWTVVAAILEELAFWRFETESANPDREVVNAVRPGMATIPNGLLWGISSPYAKSGVLYEEHLKHWGVEGSRTLVWKAPTWVMNPLVPRDFLLEERERDPASFRSEYGAEFRDDVEDFISMELLQELTIEGRKELPKQRGKSYVAFCDPSGGRSDEMTLAVAHKDEKTGRTVLDQELAVAPPFRPPEVVKQFAAELKRYGISSVTGDRYSGEWVVTAFAAEGINYEASQLSRSEIYLEFVPLASARAVELLDNQPTLRQFSKLMRKKRAGGRDIVDHPRGGRDDRANAAAGALVLAAGETADYHVGWIDID